MNERLSFPGGRLSVTQVAVDLDPWFRVVYPQDFSLPGALSLALDNAGIAHKAGVFPHRSDGSEDVGVAYLVEAERLAALGSRKKIAHALLLIEREEGAATIVLAEPGDTSMMWLAESEHVAGWLVRPLDPVAVVATVTATRRMLKERREAGRLRDMAESMTEETDRLLSIGVALSAERDISKLHELIVRNARELTRADGGSLFLLEKADGEPDKLRFAVAQTGPDDAGTHLGAVLPLTRGSVAGYVALTGEVLRIPDVYEIPETAEYRFNQSFDKQNGYRSKSIMTVPMRDHENAIVGVIQLINRKPEFELVLTSPAMTEKVVNPFTERDESVLLSLASQAGVALENKALLASIQDLFEQFVRASVKAIEVRDKSTQGHSSRVAELTVAQAIATNAVAAGRFADLHFDDDALREMRYAALLHDFGKVAVPEYIFGKAKKLPDGKLDAIRLRFLLAINQIETLAARRKFELLQTGVALDDHRMIDIDTDASARAGELQALLTTVESANEPRVVAAEIGALLDSILGKTYRDVEDERPLLDTVEFEFLRIPRGSLSNDERQKMEQHVTQSFYFLREIPWAKTPWRNVPDLAYGHHEHLDGTGYPRGLKDAEIAPQVRMLTIADVYDALTAKDRPYKAAMPVDRALDILVKEFAQRGKVDSELLDLFIARKVYETIADGTKA
jgi:HD-GYP domain-containing protein (c-di-GMP phosphodiesterase class II)